MGGNVWFINHTCDDGQINSPNMPFNPAENTSSYQPSTASLINIQFVSPQTRTKSKHAFR